MHDLLKNAVVLLVFWLPTATAIADSYHVTQEGSGDHNGSSLAHAWSVSDFNSADKWSDVEDGARIDPGDTVFFHGEITDVVTPAGSGTNAGFITLDGLEQGDYDPFSEEVGQVCRLNNSSGGSVRYDMNIVARDYLIVRDFELTGGTSGIELRGFGDDQGGRETSDHILIQDCFFHDLEGSGVEMTGYYPYASGYDTGSTDVIIGGSAGDGCVFKDIGMDTGDEDISITNVIGVTISHNRMYATKSDGLPSDRGIDGVMSKGCQNALIEYNEIHSHRHNHGDRGENGIDIASKSHRPVTNVIIRFNKVYGEMSAGIMVMGNWTTNSFVYGNYVAGTDPGIGILLHRNAHSVSVFANVVHQAKGAGIAISQAQYDPPNETGEVTDTRVFNNTIVTNGTDPSSWSRTGIYVASGADPGHVFQNNILSENRPTASIHVQFAVTESKKNFVSLDYNLYHHPNETKFFRWYPDYFDFSEINAIGHELSGLDADPLFSDPDNSQNGRYAIGSDSPARDSGNAKSDDHLPDYTNRIVINGRSFCNNQGGTCDELLSYSIALHPDTDWSVFPSPQSIVTTLQGMHGAGWERGAYVYHDPVQPDGGVEVDGDIDGGEPDAWGDAEPDAGGDVTPDAGGDVTPDAGGDAELDAGTDAGPEADADAGDRDKISGGCSCGGAPESSFWLWWLALGGIVLNLLRRRYRNRTVVPG